MSSMEHIHRLMTEIGPVMQILEIEEFEEEKVWTLLMDEQTLLFADYDEERDRLMLSIELGKPATDNPAALYESLLRYNATWQQTDGVRMGLDADDVVVQYFDITGSALDISLLQGVLHNLVQLAKHWRTALGSSTVTSSGDDNGMDSGLIKV